MDEPPNKFGKHLRDLTPAERRELFGGRKTLQQDGPPARQDQTPRVPLHDPMTADDIRDLPEVRREGDSRTPVLWVQFWHKGRKELVVARGVFDYESECWIVRYKPGEDGTRTVVPKAWTTIRPGRKPWHGPIIED